MINHNPKQIEAVLFDMAGVLVDKGYDLILGKLSKLYGVPLADMDELLKHLILDKLDIAQITYEEAVKVIESKYGHLRKARAIPDTILTRIGNLDLFNRVLFERGLEEGVCLANNRELALSIANKGYKVGILSNITESILNFYKETDFFEGFNPAYLTFSCEVKHKKPDEQIYKIALTKLESWPDETLFIDDNQEYIDAAEKLGILVYHYDFQSDDLEKKLEEFGL